jgi:hypothetical protein
MEMSIVLLLLWAVIVGIALGTVILVILAIYMMAEEI